jgi:hypothetical protein
MLKYSQNLDIHVVGGWNFGRKNSFIHVLPRIAEEIHHVRTLRLLIQMPSMSLALDSMKNPAEALETLELTVEGSSITELQINSGMFGGITPHLHHLSLDNCRVNWNSSLLQGLTHLEMLYLSWRPLESRPAPFQIFDALSRMPLLESLRLCNTLPHADRQATCWSYRVPLMLSKLMVLQIDDSLSYLIPFLASVVVSDRSKVDLTCSSDSDNALEFSNLGHALQVTNGGFDTNHICHLRVRGVESWVRIRAQLSSTVSPMVELPHDDDWPVCADVDFFFT